MKEEENDKKRREKNLIVNGIPNDYEVEKAILHVLDKVGYKPNTQITANITTTGMSEDQVNLNKLGIKNAKRFTQDSKKPKKETLEKYEKYGENPVADNLNGEFEVIRKSLIKNSLVESSQSDVLRRSYVRHDSNKLAREIMTILG